MPIYSPMISKSLCIWISTKLHFRPHITLETYQKTHLLDWICTIVSYLWLYTIHYLISNIVLTIDQSYSCKFNHITSLLCALVSLLNHTHPLMCTINEITFLPFHKTIRIHLTYEWYPINHEPNWANLNTLDQIDGDKLID